MRLLDNVIDVLIVCSIVVVAVDAVAAVAAGGVAADDDVISIDFAIDIATGIGNGWSVFVGAVVAAAADGVADDADVISIAIAITIATDIENGWPVLDDSEFSSTGSCIHEGMHVSIRCSTIAHASQFEYKQHHMMQPCCNTSTTFNFYNSDK